MFRARITPQVRLLYLLPIVVDKVATIIHSRPFLLTVRDIERSLAVKYMATVCCELDWYLHTKSEIARIPYLKRLLPCLLVFLWSTKVDRHREEKAHVPPLVHDRGPTVRTRHFGGKLVLGRLAIRGIESQAIRPIGKRNIRFREDGSPLKGCTWRKRPSEPGYHLTFLLERISHIPCTTWHPRQWQYLAFNGCSLFSS